MDLVVGATGMLGREVCHLLRQRGRSVRALARESSDPAAVDRLRRLGAEIVLGDLKDRASIEAACHGVDTVITTASSTLSRQPGDSIATVDRQGQLDLIAAAEAASQQRRVVHGPQRLHDARHPGEMEREEIQPRERDEDELELQPQVRRQHHVGVGADVRDDATATSTRRRKPRYSPSLTAV